LPDNLENAVQAANALYYAGKANEAAALLLGAAEDEAYVHAALRAECAIRAARFFSLGNSSGDSVRAAQYAISLLAAAVDEASSLEDKVTYLECCVAAGWARLSRGS
jgi:hypothetical protein